MLYIPDVRAPGAHFPGVPRRRARHARNVWEQYAVRLHPHRVAEAEAVADRQAPRDTAVWYVTALTVART